MYSKKKDFSIVYGKKNNRNRTKRPKLQNTLQIFDVYGIIKVMELHEANRILRSVKSALAADGAKLPPSAETDGLMMLLDRLDIDRFLAPKIKHALSAAPSSSTRKRAVPYTLFFRALNECKTGITDPVTTVSLMTLHKRLCGDLDPDAGKPRQKEYTENGSAHTSPNYITGSIKSIVSKMNDIPASPTISKEDFAGYLTHYMRELIILHPFECGSSFTVRLFIMLFCKIKGFSLCYYRAAPAAIKTAETAAFITDDVTPLFRIFADCLSYERTAVTTEKRRTAPKTRRELNRDRPQAKELGQAADADDTGDDAPQKERSSPQARAEITQPDTAVSGAAEKRPTDSDKLKRAIRLQQKISKLNEQLTELMSSEEQ